MVLKMNNNFHVIWSPAFYKEFMNICNYLSYSLKNPIISKKFYFKVVKRLSSLQYYPERFSKIHIFNKHNKNIRKLLIENYIIIFDVNHFIR